MFKANAKAATVSASAHFLLAPEQQINSKASFCVGYPVPPPTLPTSNGGKYKLVLFFEAGSGGQYNKGRT
jgi:hypothetical protein